MTCFQNGETKEKEKKGLKKTHTQMVQAFHDHQTYKKWVQNINTNCFLRVRDPTITGLNAFHFH